jgi:hypothetical protein
MIEANEIHFEKVFQGGGESIVDFNITSSQPHVVERGRITTIRELNGDVHLFDIPVAYNPSSFRLIKATPDRRMIGILVNASEFLVIDKKGNALLKSNLCRGSDFIIGFEWMTSTELLLVKNTAVELYSVELESLLLKTTIPARSAWYKVIYLNDSTIICRKFYCFQLASQ